MDARNHGDSPHTDHMSYASMALDVVKLVKVPGVLTAALTCLLAVGELSGPSLEHTTLY